MTSPTVGVAGSTGGGKATLTRKLVEWSPGESSVVSHDSYYKTHDDLVYEEWYLLNYDRPDTFDNDLMIGRLRRPTAGWSVECPVCDYSSYNRSDRTRRIEPAPIIMVEGVLIYAVSEICELLDIRVFVNINTDVRILRRVKCDVVKRGRVPESVERQYLAAVKPMYELYAESSKCNANTIVSNEGHNPTMLDMLVNKVERVIG